MQLKIDRSILLNHRFKADNAMWVLILVNHKNNDQKCKLVYVFVLTFKGLKLLASS